METILDSGNRREAGTGSVRDVAKGKGRFDLVPLAVVGFVLGKESRQILTSIDNYVRKGDQCELKGAINAFISSEGKDPYTTMIELSQHYEAGCDKYGERNWERGQPLSWYISSAVRHYCKHKRGDKDEKHDSAFVWNLTSCMWTHSNLPDMIDLPFKGNVPTPPASVSKSDTVSDNIGCTCSDCKYIKKTSQLIYGKGTSCTTVDNYFCDNKYSQGFITRGTPVCAYYEPKAVNK